MNLLDFASVFNSMPQRALDHIDVEQVFDSLFFVPYCTVLRGGGLEPVYLPASGDKTVNRVTYREDFVSSALHEVAHWCVAGARRRQLQDYGYWYAADGRDARQQEAFERLEIRPQAMEWVFSEASGIRFRVSADNLTSGLGPSTEFKDAIWQQVQHFCVAGLPQRAALFAGALQARSGAGDWRDCDRYRRDSL